MNKVSFIKYIVPIVLIFALVSSCERDSIKPSWDVNMLLPLMADTINIEDVLDERFFVENPDQSIALVFNEELFSMNIDSLVHLPDTLFQFGMRLSFWPEPTVHQPGDTIISQTFFLPINLQYGNAYKLLLEKAILKSGNIVFESYQESEIDLLVALGITGAEHPETGSFFAAEKVPKNQNFQKTYDIADYHLNLSGPDNDTVNMFTYDVWLIVHPDEPGEVTLYPTDSIALSILFQDIVLDYSRGYFGKNTFHIGPDVYPFDMFGDVDIQSISFDDAEVNIIIENTYGVDANVNIQNIVASNTVTGESISLESPLLNQDLYIERAVEVEPESGEILPYSGHFDFSESNFSDLLSIKPNEISYEMTMETNVTGDSSALDNFFYYDKPISVVLDVKVNGGIKIDSLFETSRMEWNAGGIDLANIRQGKLNLIFANAFPFDFMMNLYLEDEEENIIDTLVYQQAMAAGIIGSDGFVSEAQETRMSIALDDDLKQSFTQAKYSKYELLISSANGEQIKIHKSDYLKFKVVGDFEYLFEQ